MNVLVVAPHPDDEVIGCGGIIAKRVANGDRVVVAIMTEGCMPLYSGAFVENERTETIRAAMRLGVKNLAVSNFPAAMLDTVPQWEINLALNEIFKNFQPDEVYIPHKGDIHKDHQIIAAACMVAARPKAGEKSIKVLAYETISETDWNEPSSENAFIPNVFVDITNHMKDKLEAMGMYKSQLQDSPAARSLEGMKAVAAHRGAIVGVKYAEAFMLIREVEK